MSAPTTRAVPNNRRPSRRRNSPLIVVYLSLGGLAFSVLSPLVAPALSTIGTDLGVSTTDVTWILTRPGKSKGGNINSTVGNNSQIDNLPNFSCLSVNFTFLNRLCWQFTIHPNRFRFAASLAVKLS